MTGDYALTCLPMTPMHAMEGTRVDMVLAKVWCKAVDIVFRELSITVMLGQSWRMSKRVSADGVREGDLGGAVVRAGSTNQPAFACFGKLMTAKESSTF